MRVEPSQWDKCPSETRHGIPFFLSVCLSLTSEDTAWRQPQASQKEFSLEMNQIGTSIPDFYSPELWEINSCHLSHPVSGALLWQPELTKTQSKLHGKTQNNQRSIFHPPAWERGGVYLLIMQGIVLQVLISCSALDMLPITSVLTLKLQVTLSFQNLFSW